MSRTVVRVILGAVCAAALAGGLLVRRELLHRESLARFVGFWAADSDRTWTEFERTQEYSRTAPSLSRDEIRGESAHYCAILATLLLVVTPDGIGIWFVDSLREGSWRIEEESEDRWVLDVGSLGEPVEVEKRMYVDRAARLEWIPTLEWVGPDRIRTAFHVMPLDGRLGTVEQVVLYRAGDEAEGRAETEVSRPLEALHGTWEDEQPTGSGAWVRFTSNEMLYFDDIANWGYRRYELAYDIARHPWRLDARGPGELAGTLLVHWEDGDHIIVEQTGSPRRFRRTQEIDWDQVVRRDRCVPSLCDLRVHMEIAKDRGLTRFPDLARAILRDEDRARCPRNRGSGASYASWLRGDLSGIGDDAEIPILWDASPDFHEGERCVAFLNGHTRFLDEGEFQELLSRWRERGFSDRPAVGTDVPFELDQVREILQPGEHKVDVLQLQGPPRLQELTAKLQEAVRKEPEWWMDHVRNAQGGKPLPYDERLGLTEAEYGEYLRLAASMHMMKVSEAILSIRRLEDGTLVLAGTGGLQGFGPIWVDLERNVATVEHAALSEVVRIRAKQEQRATGPWDGYGWKGGRFDLEGGLEGSHFKTELVVGRMQETGESVLYYTSRVLESGRKAESVDVFLRFPD